MAHRHLVTPLQHLQQGSTSLFSSRWAGSGTIKAMATGIPMGQPGKQGHCRRRQPSHRSVCCFRQSYGSSKRVLHPGASRGPRPNQLPRRTGLYLALGLRSRPGGTCRKHLGLSMHVWGGFAQADSLCFKPASGQHARQAVAEIHGRRLLPGPAHAVPTPFPRTAERSQRRRHVADIFSFTPHRPRLLSCLVDLIRSPCPCLHAWGREQKQSKRC